MSIQKLVTIKRSKKARRLALRLDPQERVVNLIVPPYMPLHKAYFFAQTHAVWVRETLDNLAPPIPFVHKAVLSIFGDPVRLHIEYDPDMTRTTIKLDGDVLRVRSWQEDPTNRITAFLKKMAREGLADIASEKASVIRRKITSVTVRDTKSRWGSCAQDGSLSFSWRLIFAPYEAIDYVVAHEVAHLMHMDHGPKFWALCEKLSMNYEDGKTWMQSRGNELMRYGKTA